VVAAFLALGVLGVEIAVCEVAAHWLIDEMEGKTTQDASGNGNDGTVLGPEWMLVEARTCLSFDGLDDLVRVDDHPSLNVARTTIEAIIHVNSADEGGILAKWGYGGNDDSYILYVDSGHLNARIARDGQPGQTVVTSLDVLPIDECIHVAATYDGLSLRVFVNYELQGETAAEGMIRSTENDVILGLEEIISGSRGFLDGYVAEARVSTEALDPTQFLQMDTIPTRVSSWGTLKSNHLNSN
jgi:hypothetical protein